MATSVLTVRERNVSGSFLSACRGILAIVVCFAHTWQKIVSPQFGDYGWEHAVFGISARVAVDMFYVISGWVIYYSISANIHRFGRFNPFDWYENRSFRILPPLLVSIAMTVAILVLVRGLHLDRVASPYGIVPFIYSYRPDDVAITIATFGFFGNLSGGVNGPLWSLAIEMQLYFLVCLCFWISERSRLALIFLLLIIAYRMSLDANYLLGYMSFFFGFAGSWLYQRSPRRGMSDLLLLAISFILIIGALLYLFYSYAVDNSYLDRLSQWGSVSIQLALSLGFAVYLYTGIVFSFPSLVERSGDFSYTLYIVHFPILILLSYIYYAYFPLLGSVSFICLLFVASSSLCIFISWRIGTWAERPKEQKSRFNKHVRNWRERRL